MCINCSATVDLIPIQELDDVTSDRDDLADKLEKLAGSYEVLLEESKGIQGHTEGLLAENLDSLVQLEGKFTAAQVGPSESTHNSITGVLDVWYAVAVPATAASQCKQHDVHTGSIFTEVACCFGCLPCTGWPGSCHQGA